MGTKREGFFGTDNLHRAGWAAVIGFAGFLGALVYHNMFGPQRVVVETMPAQGSSAQITTLASPRSNEIGELAEAIRKLADATSTNGEQKRLRELSDDVDRLRAEVAQSASRKASPITFALPKSAKGYTTAELFGVSASTCPPNVVAPGESLRVNFDLVDQSLLSRGTPVRATIVRVRTPTDLLQIEEVWIEMQPSANTIALNPKLKPGEYQFIYGFYLRNELSGEYPEFYSRECAFVVRGT